MTIEPRSLQLASGHLASHGNLKSPLAERHGRELVGGEGEIVVEEFVGAVAEPVEVFLEGDHLETPFLACLCSIGPTLFVRHRADQQTVGQ